MNLHELKDLIRTVQWKNNITIYTENNPIPVIGNAVFNPENYELLSFSGNLEQYLPLFSNSRLSTNLEKTFLYFREDSENVKGITICEKYLKFWEYTDKIWIVLNVFKNKCIWNIYYPKNHPSSSVTESIKWKETTEDIITAGSKTWMSHKDRQEFVRNRTYRNEK